MVQVRQATKSDVPAMLALHREAVRRTASAFHSQNVVHSWTSGSDPENAPATIARMRQRLSSGEMVGYVAEIENKIVGFGELAPQENELRAVYVHPDHGRKGIGGQLMQALDQAARDLGMPELKMDASINAEAFYTRHGFEVVERGEHTLRNGLKMACVKMRKSLAR